MQAILLCGGEGARLRPLTCDMPKPMLPLLGQPVLRYSLDHLRKQGFDDFFLTLHYLPQRIMRAFRNEPGVHFALEEEPLGTAGCVKALEDELHGTFAVVSGDALTDVDFAQALAFHRNRHADVTLILKKVDCPVEYGVVTLSESGMVQGFQEKPAWGQVESNLANTGMYLVEPCVLKLLRRGQNADFAKELFPLMQKQGLRLAGYVTENYWCDIGSFEAYRQAQMDLLTGKTRLALSQKTDKEGIYIAPTARVDESCTIQAPCWIGDGCQLQSYCQVGPGVVLGRSSVLGHEATIRQTVTGEHCRLELRAQVRDAILDDGVRVRDGAEVFDGAVLGKQVVLDEFAHVEHGARIWPGKQIPCYSVVKEDHRWEASPSGLEAVIKEESWQELSVEQLFALGQALPVLGDKVVLSYDGGTMAKSAWEILKAAVLCSGAVVQPVPETVGILHRYAQRKLKIPVGVHLAPFADGYRMALTGETGANLKRNELNRLERNMRTKTKGEIGSILPDIQMEEAYLADLKKQFGSLNKRIDMECADTESDLAMKVSEALGLDFAYDDTAEGKLILREDGFDVFDGQNRLMDVSSIADDRAKYDGFWTLAYLLQQTGGRLDDWFLAHPAFREQQKRIPCPWKARGRVIASVHQWPHWHKEERQFVCSEHPGFCIQPDENLPIIRLVGRNMSQEMADELFSEYEKKLLEQMKM